MAFRQGLDNYVHIGCKCPPDEAKEFEKKTGRRNKSLVLRELIRKFNSGEIKITITQTLGGDEN